MAHLEDSSFHTENKGKVRTDAGGRVAAKCGLRAIREMHARPTKGVGEHARRRRLVRVDVPVESPLKRRDEGYGEKTHQTEPHAGWPSIWTALPWVLSRMYSALPRNICRGMNGRTVGPAWSHAPSWQVCYRPGQSPGFPSDKLERTSHGKIRGMKDRRDEGANWT